jgi:hypothetical protein
MILDSDMTPKITDFELSEVLPDDVDRTDSGYLVGTMYVITLLGTKN